MAFREEVIQNPHYLHVRSTGILTPKLALESFDNIAAWLDETGHDLVLLDDSGTELESAPMFEYEQANHAAQLFANRCRRFALLGNPDYLEYNEFFETVCVNRGLKLKHFTDEQEAVDWLLAAPERSQPAACK